MHNRVGTALASISAGATTGAAVMTAGVLLLRSLQARDVSPDTGFLVLSVGVLAGLALAVASGWHLARTIDDSWRRGVIAALSVFGACLLGIVAAPADMAAGRSGLFLYLIALSIAVVAARRAAHRTAAR